MREIKFRAWDKESKEMLPMDLFKEDWLDEQPVFIPMQYTGLKDKNGKEIYEGDIVKVKGTVFVPWHTKVVLFWQGSFCTADSINGKSRNRLLNPRKIFRANIEIIGNIYENPELLS